MKALKKQKSYAFGKVIYLLGIDKFGKKRWLEAPSWECGWFWGFGYVETYTNNSNPTISKDISSHTHIDIFFKKNDVINLNNVLKTRTFTIEEGKRLNELFSLFYQLKDKANEQINTVEIPNITKEIIEILTY